MASQRLTSTRAKVYANAAEQECADRLRERGFEPMKRGWPDFFAISEDGEVVIVEVKPAAKNPLKDQQRIIMTTLARAGIRVERFDPEQGFVLHSDDGPAVSNYITSVAAGSLQQQTPSSFVASGTRPPTDWAAIRATLTELFGTPTNKNERGRRARATSLIAESLTAQNDDGVDARWEIRARHNRWASVFPGATVTDIALANRWSDLRPPARKLAANEKPGWYDDGLFVPNPELVKSWNREEETNVDA